MGFNLGIIGLPNVGKSTIFNALTSAGAQAANYPFCTIEPNTGVVPLEDERLKILSRAAKSEKIVPTAVEFVDIAGLVAGASKGEGLGNQFLGHIRAVDAVIHVVRCFHDDNITHVHGDVSPRRDVEVIDTELLLADLAAVEKRLEKVVKTAKGGDKDAIQEQSYLESARDALGRGERIEKLPDPAGFGRKLGLITAKPMLFQANVSEGDANLSAEDPAPQGSPLAELQQLARERGDQIVVISGNVEAEISALPETEREAFLSELGLASSGLTRLAQAGHELLNLITFFTVGPKEAHAWTTPVGSLAPQAAGKIHSDFEKGFIRAEVIGYEDFVSSGGENQAKEKGLMRVEGKTYVVRDGDIVHFRFNV